MSSCSQHTFGATILGALGGLLSPFGLSGLFSKNLINPIHSDLSEAQYQNQEATTKWNTILSKCASQTQKDTINLLVGCMDCSQQELENIEATLTYRIDVNTILIIFLLVAVFILYIYDLLNPVQ